MLITDEIKNAFAEAYVILENLDEESYKKIPAEVIETIKENRNLEYKYSINKEMDLNSQPLLPETQALLSNIYRDYLAGEEEREEILKKQQIERNKLEEKKQKEYNVDLFEKKDDYAKKIYPIKYEKEPFFKKVILKIKKMFKL